MKKVIHVNKQIIGANRKHGRDDPPLTCKTYKSNEKGHEIAVYDKQGNEVGRFVYRPNKPLSCGARVWFETECETRVVK